MAIQRPRRQKLAFELPNLVENACALIAEVVRLEAILGQGNVRPEA
ncbi:MAG: hypothetical protein R3E12_17420 [Candidatus Eisenbacteria bacterium]